MIPIYFTSLYMFEIIILLSIANYRGFVCLVQIIYTRVKNIRMYVFLFPIGNIIIEEQQQYNFSHT